MKYINLGQTGLKVSRIGLGCMSYGDPNKGNHSWVLNEEEGRVYIRKAIEAGINLFDTANVYSDGASEEVLGRAIRDFASRDAVVLATKIFYPMSSDVNAGGLSRKAIFTEVENSLKRLNSDYIDLLQIHRWDDFTPIEETLEALNDVVKSGKARYLGASSMFAWQFMKALGIQRERGWAPFVSMQNHLNLLYREEEREMLPLCISEGIGVIPWSPLARGRLTRPWSDEPATERAAHDNVGANYYSKAADADRIVVDRVGEIAEALNQPRAQVALAWLLHKQGVTAPIVGATKPKHLEDALGALELVLSPAQIEKLEEPYVPHHLSGHG
ncbi:aldo/keto reductase [Mesorhizobium sp. CGMCC 1.15528]|uniref:Aldo/keto reductase n=1 Tax=Mesorhizobium zhangyense TaxID=1776730 RepID=A0A7C9RAA4_9HYPH|nr:aldo/keto reductase [Mesorhizobium zhangyense]NGN43559.1 aldo/keto reductase [Mesorhizobium zhangyense]